MKLEQLRSDELGQTFAWFPRKPEAESAMTRLTFPAYCTKAFYLTCQAIEQLELSRGTINQGGTSLLAVGMWFIAIESFVNSLVRIACRMRDENFREYKGKDLGIRLKYLLDMPKVNSVELYKSGIFQRLEEFKTFRNEIFHDRTWENDLRFHKTSFASSPSRANQVDCMQAAIIALEISHAFRYIYDGLDLLPDILVHKEDSFGFIKFDIVYSEFLRPFFVESLKKHGLDSDIVLVPSILALATTDISVKGDVGVIVKAVQEKEFEYSPNEAVTTIGADLFKNLSAKLTLNPSEEFGVGNYFRK